MATTLELRLEDADAALDRFEAAWNLLDEGGRLPPRHILALPDLPALLKALTPARWAMLERLGGAGPCTVYALARRLGRDYKNVHGDVRALESLGLVARLPDGRIGVPWDAIRAELRLEPDAAGR